MGARPLCRQPSALVAHKLGCPSLPTCCGWTLQQPQSTSLHSAGACRTQGAKRRLCSSQPQRPRRSCHHPRLSRTAANPDALTTEGAIPADIVDNHAEALDAALPEESPPVSVWELLRFTLPTLGVWIINPILSLVDTAVVGTKSAVELGALGPGTMLCDYNAYIFTFLAIATTNLLATNFARKDRAQASRTLSDAIAIAAVSGVAIGVGLYAIAPWALAKIAGQRSAAVVAPAITYVRIRCLGLPAALLMFVTQAYFLAAIDPITPLVAALAAGVINLIGDLALVNGLGMGIAGAAWATSASQVVTAAMLVRALYQPLRPSSLLPGWKVDIRWRFPTLKAAFKFLNYAGPICGVLVSKVLMYGALTSFASNINPTASAAHHVVFSVFMFFATFGDAVSQAAQSFLPGAVGQPKKAWKMAKDLVFAGAWVGAANSIASAALLLLLPQLFTNTAAVVTAMQQLVVMSGVVLVIHTCSMATEGMLLAGRDLMFLVVSYAINCILVMGGLWLVRRQAWGLVGVWCCIGQFQGTRLVLNWLRLVGPKSPLNSTQELSDALG